MNKDEAEEMADMFVSFYHQYADYMEKRIIGFGPFKFGEKRDLLSGTKFVALPVGHSGVSEGCRATYVQF